MGIFWSSQPETLIDVRNKFLTSPTVLRFQDIEDNLSWYEKCNLGFTYKVWRTTCLYTFMMQKRTNLTSDSLICDFRDKEQEVIQGFTNCKDWALYPMFILWRVTGNKKYEKIIYSISDPDYKREIDIVLTDIIV